MMKPVTVGLIVGNRGFFPSHLAESGRAEMLQILDDAGFKVITLSPTDTTYGSIVSVEDSRKCAELFEAHRHEISRRDDHAHLAALVGAKGSCLDPGLSRCGGEHDHCRPPRLLLWQDVAM